MGQEKAWEVDLVLLLFPLARRSQRQAARQSDFLSVPEVKRPPSRPTIQLSSHVRTLRLFRPAVSRYLRSES